jgi:hypothetical protein
VGGGGRARGCQQQCDACAVLGEFGALTGLRESHVAACIRHQQNQRLVGCLQSVSKSPSADHCCPMPLLLLLLLLLLLSHPCSVEASCSA